MDQRVSFITLVVTDLDVTRRFYVDGLGWEPELDVPGEVLMFKVAEKVVLSLWVEEGFVAEVGHAPARGDGVGDAQEVVVPPGDGRPGTHVGGHGSTDCPISPGL